MKLSQKLFGTVDGHDVIEYTVENQQGMQLSMMNYGATLTALKVPDKTGKCENIVLGFDSLKAYQKHEAFFGATVGRVAGRIAKGEFELNGKNYQLSQNEGENHLHGGGVFNRRIWESESFVHEAEAGVLFRLTSEAGECGYPGNLMVEVRFTLTELNQWKVHYFAESDEDTLFNPTNHVYFNLTGDPKRSILSHELQLASDEFVALKSDLLPTGELESVAGTSFDFRKAEMVKRGTESQHPQNQFVAGYDHAFCFSDDDKNQVKGTLFDSVSGRRLILYTDMPSVVVYSGNQLHGEFEIDGEPVRQYAGITLETQALPDAIHHPGFGSIVLKGHEKFESETIYQFDNC